MNNIKNFIEQESIAMATPEDKWRILNGHFMHYLEECFEAFVAFVFYTLLTNNAKFDFYRAIRVSLIVGLLTFSLEIYKPDFKANVKSGMVASIGSGMIRAGGLPPK